MEHKRAGALLRKFCLGMEDRKELEDIKPMIAEYNHKMLAFSSMLFFIIFVILAGISFIGVSQVYEVPVVYIGMAAISIGIYLLTRFVFKPETSGRAILVTFYVLELVGYAYGFYTGIAHGPFPAVTFIVMLIILPSLPCDCPWRGNLLLMAMGIIFLFCSRRVKAPTFFSNDVGNVISYVLVSFFMHMHQQMSRMDDFTNRLIIKIQRDTDSLTGTMTKAAFEANSIRVLRSESCEGCLLVIDIDNFKNINDSFGHSIGDFFIANTGRCILECCRTSDFVGRFGGDEFVILMQGKLTKEIVESKVNAMTETLKEFFLDNTKYEHYSVSVGCTLFQGSGAQLDYNSLFNQADQALYVAKNSGKNRCVVYGNSNGH
ncbi:MAG: GGDEF domain-containing protein [Treponema sp.]|nr:GGDEF domain-containing protein [Treponema sp.]